MQTLSVTSRVVNGSPHAWLRSKCRRRGEVREPSIKRSANDATSDCEYLQDVEPSMTDQRGRQDH